MSEREFLKCSPRYWRLRLDGMRQAQQQEYRNQWEITRWAVATTMAPHLKKPIDRKSTRLNSSHSQQFRMPSSA